MVANATPLSFFPRRGVLLDFDFICSSVKLYSWSALNMVKSAFSPKEMVDLRLNICLGLKQIICKIISKGISSCPNMPKADSRHNIPSPAYSNSHNFLSICCGV